MRKTKPKKRILLPDPRYNDPYVTRFVNNMMLDGKKSKAYDIFYEAMDLIEQRTKDEGKPALEIFKAALDNITPQVEVKSRRVGGATFQVPMEVRPSLAKTGTKLSSKQVRLVWILWSIRSFVLGQEASWKSRAA